jgi:hypothetical protein
MKAWNLTNAVGRGIPETGAKKKGHRAGCPVVLKIQKESLREASKRTFPIRNVYHESESKPMMIVWSWYLVYLLAIMR